MADIAVVIADDDAGYRETLGLLFSSAPGFTLAGSFESGPQALEAARERGSGWNLAFVDFDMPGMNGIVATRRLKEMWPDLKVIVLTVFEEPAVILEAICAGADGYLFKKSSDLDLLDQAEVVVRGDSPLTGGVARIVLELLRDRIPAPRRPSLKLSPREEGVLGLLVEGQSYKQIADSLGLSLDTVRSSSVGSTGSSRCRTPPPR